ncbi:ATP-dependent nuclease [Paenibacillus agri]|uniref:AAA family ATPase n=1 Tax=Paenibacillus agri TaxID=2744309 RepID=A0A850ENB3_9BACL|nr:AAA family ATPase [Paenibacillus agri]NUU61260.1 AAA family ATPase [Paenibacillus agri]
MFLKTLEMKNFRNINDLAVDFHKGLNILVGENNSGKSAIIDALRICLSYGKQSRDLYVKRSDFHINRNDPVATINPIEFHLTFEIEDPIETGIFNDLLSQNQDPSLQWLKIHFIYRLEDRNGLEKIKYTVWGGDNEGQQITPDVFSLLLYVYLDALRDASHNLRPVRGNRLGELYAHLREDSLGNPITDEKRDELTQRLRNSLTGDVEWNNIIETGKKKINEHLEETSITNKKQAVEVDFLPFEFRKIVDNLRVLLPVFDESLLEGDTNKQKYFDINQNGLGYNNLLYMAAILGDLKNRKELDPEAYIALFIEEPEAHLHPQLQSIFFNYLNKLDGIGFQIFITSHSPTITAKANLDSLIIVQCQNNQVFTYSLLQSELSDQNKIYLGKFLDVTKSQLFFSNGVIFVEGISEALLLQKFSKILGTEYDLDKMGVEIVIVNGVSFEHFGKLFNSDEAHKRLNIRSVIITDDDRDQTTDEISSRADNALALKNGFLHVETSEITFEYELFIAGEYNRELMLLIYSEMHPVSASRISEGNDIKEYAKNFLAKVASNKAKSELSHRLALYLESNESARRQFIVPDYIKRSINWVIKGDLNV